MKRIIIKILERFNLGAELENPELVHDEITKGIGFSGTNLWVLMFATMVASVGLNMNSTAVIIGAMLISPLMGPINGMGYSIATYNFDMFRLSIKNFSYAVITSLFTSTIYFTISPISTAYSELLARTSPSIYDVLIAFFGGLAGIVATGSKLKGNVIPGVAIATALIPPLCTAGYGLATAQFDFFFGALYLFTINTVFIALASIAVSQIMNFPIRTIIDNAKKTKINRMISLVTGVVLLPSIYFGYVLVKEEKFKENAIRYINNISIVEGHFLLDKNINPKNRSIILVYGGTKLTDDIKAEIENKAQNFNLNDVEIKISQGFSLDAGSGLLPENYQLKEEVIKLKSALENIETNKSFGDVLLQEISTIYPNITNCYYAEIETTKGDVKEFPMVIISKKEEMFSEEVKQKIRNWLKSRLKNNEVKVIFQKI